MFAGACSLTACARLVVVVSEDAVKHSVRLIVRNLRQPVTVFKPFFPSVVACVSLLCFIWLLVAGTHGVVKLRLGAW